MIYFISAKHYVKIGYSKNPKERLKELQTGNPIKLKLLGTIVGGYETEATLHKIFKKYRGNGEWFKNKGYFKKCMIALSDSFYDTSNIKLLQQAGLELHIRQKANKQNSNKLKNRINRLG